MSTNTALQKLSVEDGVQVSAPSKPSVRAVDLYPLEKFPPLAPRVFKDHDFDGIMMEAREPQWARRYCGRTRSREAARRKEEGYS